MTTGNPGGSTGVAIVGCGLVGAKRLGSLPPGTRVVALADPDPSRAETLAATLPHEVAVTDSAEAALSRPGIDLAIIATVHSALVPAAVTALQAGCHVLVEKPGAHRLADLASLHDEACAANRNVRVGFNHRFHPSVMKARELTASGGYGELLYIRGRYGHGGRLGYEREWRLDPELSGGGELLDQGMHLIDLTRVFAGELDLVFAETRTDFWDASVEDNAYLALRPKAGGFAWLHASWTEWKNLFSFEVSFRRAKLELHGLGGSYGPERLTLHLMGPDMGPPETMCWEWPQPDRSWALEIRDVLESIAGRQAAGAGLDDCIAAFRIVDEAYRR